MSTFSISNDGRNCNLLSFAALYKLQPHSFCRLEFSVNDLALEMAAKLMSVFEQLSRVFPFSSRMYSLIALKHKRYLGHHRDTPARWPFGLHPSGARLIIGGNLDQTYLPLTTYLYAIQCPTLDC